MTAPESEWLTAKQAADRANRHVNTVHRAAEHGDLHGHQTKRCGRWSFRPASVDAYIAGLDSAAACGCRRLRLVRGRAA